MPLSVPRIALSMDRAGVTRWLAAAFRPAAKSRRARARQQRRATAGLQREMQSSCAVAVHPSILHGNPATDSSSGLRPGHKGPSFQRAELHN